MTTAARPLDERSKALRRLIVRALAGARRGHVGAAYSLVEIFRVLYDDVLRYDATNPEWVGRDRCILSKGHGCLALYAILADKGFFPHAELDKFCAADGILGGHPDANKVPGVEASTGALGHGLPIGLGFALHAKTRATGAKVFVVMGDGECNEGSVWEAAMSAGKHRLDNLYALVDYNKLQSYGPVAEVQPLEPFAAKWRAFGFGAVEVDGHDVDALRAVLAAGPVEPGKPTAVLCHTVKGKGAAFAEHNLKWHHKNKLTDDEITNLYSALEAA